MTFQNLTIHTDSLKRDYCKLKQVIHHPNNKLNNLASIVKYTAYFIAKHDLKEDNIVMLELNELLEKLNSDLHGLN